MLRHWIDATRPKTLPAAAVPVLVGSAEAYRLGHFAWWPALVCFGFAALVQIATNLANDYFDYIRGADTADRLGPERMVASGRIAPRSMLYATWIVFAAAFALGLLLVDYRGWELLIIGVVSVGFGYGYTGGPFPLAYKGLGDVFVVLFFGLVATLGTVYVLAGFWSWPITALAGAIGLLANNILVANNYRDRETDLRAGKRTLIARWGRSFGLWQFRAQCATAYLGLSIYAWGIASPAALLPALTLPIAWRVARRMPQVDGAALNGILAASAGLLLAFGVLACIGIALSR